MPGASFAGQQDTYLNVTGTTELLAAIRRCWASLWNARAVAYRERAEHDPAIASASRWWCNASSPPRWPG
ncbi:MAG: PEP/pyruvate-binding domain-containing protein [Micropruina sp.]